MVPATGATLIGNNFYCCAASRKSARGKDTDSFDSLLLIDDGNRTAVKPVEDGNDPNRSHHAFHSKLHRYPLPVRDRIPVIV